MVYMIEEFLLLLVLLFFIGCSLTTFLPADPFLDARTGEMDGEIDENNEPAMSLVP